MKICKVNLAVQIGGSHDEQGRSFGEKQSREQNKDVYEIAVLKQANSSGIIVMAVLAVVFFSVQIFAGGGQNWGMWALVFSPGMATSWVKYIKLGRKRELPIAIAYTVIVAVSAGYHIYNLIAPSAIL